MKKSKSIIALAIAMLMCLSILAACGGGDDTNTSSDPSASAEPSVAAPFQEGQAAPDSPAPTGTDVVFAEEIIIITDNNDISVLNSFLPSAGAPPVSWTTNMVYDRLIYPLGGGQYEPYLALDWTEEVIDGNQVLTFWLREDVYFHNGENLTASDVVFTLEKAGEDMTGTNHGYWHPTGFNVTASALDTYTVQIVLDRIFVDYLFNLSNPYCWIASEKAMRDDPLNGYMVGSGAFKYVEFVPSNYWVVERNDDYWGEPAITRQVTFRFIPEQGTRTIMMLNGEAQLSFGISGEDMEIFETSDDFQLFPFTFNNPNCISFNMDDPILADWNFRMAVASALDRAEIAVVAAGAYAAPDYSGSLWGFSTEFRNDTLDQIPEDLDAARAYLEASIYAGEEIEIASSILTYTKQAEIIQQQLARIGILTTLNVMDPPAMTAYTDRNNNQSQITSGLVVMTEAASSYRGAIYPEATGNRVMYDNERIGELLDLAMGELDQDIRRGYWFEIQEILAQDIPRINTFWRLNAAVAVPGIGGFALPSTALYDLRYIYWQIEG